ncbi:MAG TPA: IS1595 family transposase [Ferruginibacter sp.]|nr:IS1595 family transposase [Ferruginibacter sp.]HMP22304.1 IS1595 family transposase [Ferruginibacter sp.]
MKTFKSILEFQKEFSDEQKCREYLEQQRWNGTPACPFCGSINVHRFPNGKIFKCREKGCRNKFSVTVGTIYENTKIPLTKWFLATYILSVHSKGISSLQLANWLGVTQKTAWHLNHRIREMLTDNAPELLEGIVEVDETLVGGSLKNIHASKKKRLNLKRDDNKTMVFGAIQRDGKVRTKVIPDVNIENISEAIDGFVSTESFMVSDENRAYNNVGKKYKHRKVNHRNGEYVRKEDILVHTNNIEGYWNILKKQIDGIHHSVSPKHLQRYCNESAFRFNNRALFQDERFAKSLANCKGSLKYKKLIGK